MNEGLKRNVNKCFVLHVREEGIFFTFADEPPGGPIDNNTVAAAANANDLLMWFSSRTFIAGDLAFFAVILGKENMLGSWCNWCKLSQKGWSKFGHEKGELWSIEKINNIRNNVENGTLAETPAN
mmetsp:Transcript_16263/g.23224  ORF Transcript_16263/g.23224 Transcript_16263/m.23224 type:complete len:125 (+) Transcript_16263:1330-1704(+)